MTEPPQRSDTSFRRRFAELSLEKKLTIFFVPVFAALVGTLVPRFLGEGGGEGSDGPLVVISGESEPRTANLGVVSIEVVNGPDSEDAEIQLLVQNTGVVDSIIHSASFRVVHYTATETCYVPEGQLEVSGRYDLVLPVHGGDDKSFDVSLQQEVPAGEGDRFSFTVQVRGDIVPTTPRLYALEVRLFHDQEEEPLPARVALVALPFPLWEGFVYPGIGPYGGYFDPECPARNSARLAELLALEGVRSNELEAFGADHEAFLEVEREPFPPPTAADLAEATATAAALSDDLAAGRLAAACDAFEPGSLASIRALLEASCPEFLTPFAELVSAGANGSLSISEAHPGWIKVAAPDEGDGHQLVIVLQRTPHPRAPERFEWLVTNVYDAAVGPLDLSGEEPEPE
jgi:hypothetical protein